VLIAAQASAQVDTIQTGVPALKLVYAGDFTIGCLLSYRNIGFPSDPPVPGQSAVITPNGGYLIKFHMNCMSPGNNMKPQYTVDIAASASAYLAAAAGAAKDSVDTHPVVKFNGDLIAQLNWAQRQGFTFRGHTLIWHNQTPATFFLTGYATGGARLSKAQMTERMRNYIKEVIRLIHEGWPGLLSAMDVVNEAMNDNGTFRTSGNDWYTTFGDTTYVMKAFEFVRLYTTQYGETQIKLYYNDYNTSTATKADGIVRLCTPIFQAGFLDGIGMQEHDNLTTSTAQAFVDTYNKFSPVCTEMSVTEFDVATGSASPSAPVLATQANQYGQLFKCFVERSYRSGRGKIINVSKDGLNDQYTFQTNQASSLWDALNQCKPAFFAVAGVGIHYNALDSLMTYAGTLNQIEYTPSSWSGFTAALTAAGSVRAQNFSNSVSADTALGTAAANLAAGIAALVRVSAAVDNPGTPVVQTFALGQNYPNPFNPLTQIRYAIPSDGYVSLKVFNMLGAEVAVLYAGFGRAGDHVATFNGTGLPSGMYLYRLMSGNFTSTKKLVLLR
jgi:endo-1,4-beta-xylanase